MPQPSEARRVYLAGPPYAEEYRLRAEALVRALGWEPVDPMRRDYRGRTEGNEPAHPWTVYVADVICAELESAVRALSGEATTLAGASP